MPNFTDKDNEPYADEKLFEDLGKYLVFFQSLESSFDKMLLLAIGHGRYQIGRAILTKLSNREKIDILNAAIINSGIKQRAEEHVPDWISEFRVFIAACAEEAATRNSLAHANFLFDFVKIGDPVINTKTTLNKNGTKIRSDSVTASSMKEALERVAQLCCKAGFIHLQLVAWSEHFESGFSEGADSVEE